MFVRFCSYGLVDFAGLTVVVTGLCTRSMYAYGSKLRRWVSSRKGFTYFFGYAGTKRLMLYTSSSTSEGVNGGAHSILLLIGITGWSWDHHPARTKA